MQRLLFLVFTLFHFSATLASPFTKELWFDELVSVYVGRQPDMAGVWRALSESADAMPPLYHLATRAARAVVGSEALAARLPSAIGYWVLSLCIWTFLRRRLGDSRAWAGLAVTLLPASHYFATEGRSYGLMLGFTGLAVLAWRSRRLALFALSLWAAVCSHYYAVFLAIPFGLAALRPRRDVPVLACVASMAIPLALHLPLIRAATIYRADVWAAPKLTTVFTYYLDFVSGIGPAMVFGLVAAGVAGLVAGGERRPASFEPDEVWLMAGFLLIPQAVLASSFLATHTYFARYAAPTVFGMSMLAALALRSAPRVAAAFSATVMLVLSLAKVQDMAANWRNLPTAPALARVAERATDTVVLEEPLTYLQAVYYSPESLRPKLLFLLDPDAAMRETSLANPDIGLDRLRPYAPVRLDRPGDFFAANREFHLLVNPKRPGWILPDLARRGARMEVVDRYPIYWLLRVRL